jgi:septum formation protein
MKIILGSQSAGRKKVLEKMGYTFEIMPADIDEKAIRFDDPTALTLALAHAKADKLLPQIHEPAILITSDQVVVCNRRILEKPASEQEAREYLAMHSQNPAETVTSVVVVNTKNGKQVEGTDIAKIWFRSVPEETITQYIKTRDPFIHSGGFDHEHPLLAPYVEKIEGEAESITGLPKSLTKKLIRLVKD